MEMATLYVGIERDRAGRTIDPAIRALCCGQLRAEAVSRFGGYTLTNVEGAERDGPEAAIRLEVLYANRQEVREFARWAGRLFNQRSVLLSFGVYGEIVDTPAEVHPDNDPRHLPGIMSPVPLVDSRSALVHPLDQSHPRLAGYRDANPGRAVPLGGIK